MRATTLDGEEIICQCRIRPVHDGESVSGAIASIVDATESHNLQTQLVDQVARDGLTGLPNRQALQDHSKAHAGQPMAVLFIDLDDFKLVNDELGHEAGDALLLSVRDEETATALARRVADEFNSSGATLIANADLAMYEAKRDGGSQIVFFHHHLRDRLQRRLRIESDLIKASGAGQLELHLQPIFELEDPSLVGAEALIRWRHPKLGLLGPAVILGAAGRCGMRKTLTEWIVDDACRIASQMHHRGLGALAINASGHELMAAGFRDIIANALERHRLPPSTFHLHSSWSRSPKQCSLTTAARCLPSRKSQTLA